MLVGRRGRRLAKEGLAPLIAAALALWAAFAVLTWLVLQAPQGVLAFDLRLGAAVHAVADANPWLVDAALLLEVVGGVAVSTAVVAFVALALLATGGRHRPLSRRTLAAGFLVLSAAGGALLDSLAKHVVDRPRPPWNGLWSLEASSSYPSGHAQAGITVWVALGLVALVLLRGRARWIVGPLLVALGPLIGLSRTVLGVHWPTDVLGGWTLGGAWLATCAVLVIAAAASSRPTST